MGFDTSHLDDFLRSAPPAGRLCVAFSGGLDSHVLLHALVNRAETPPLHALHVHHGLQEDAEDWVAHCQSVCEALNVPLDVLRVSVDPSAEQGLEAAAREARYAALVERLHPGDFLLTAHHLDDQAETVLLQLMRGAGPAGLAAMPRLAPLGTGWLGRPLLGVARTELEAYARKNGLQWIEDPSNADLRFDRNYLRHEILPRLADRWPAVTRNLVTVAQIQADSLAQLDALAREDMERCRGSDPQTLSVSALQSLRRGRRRNLLRLWLLDKGLETPPRTRMDSILETVLDAAEDREPCVRWGEVEVRRYRDDLYATPSLAPAPTLPASWQPDTVLPIPELGIELDAQWLMRQGVDTRDCRAPFVLAYRQGGERIRLPGRAHSSALKALMQEAGIPPWERDRVPLLFRNGRLLAVWGLWCADAAEFQDSAPKT